MTDVTTLPYYQLFIDGEWCDGSAGQTMLSQNPASGYPWAKFACASCDDVDRTVTAARRARKKRRALNAPGAPSTMTSSVVSARAHPDSQ